MEPSKYIWMDGEMVEWNDAKIHVLTHGLHYGGAVFEGIRFYETDKGPAIFRLKEHIERLIFSAKTINIDSKYSIEEFEEAVIKIVKDNKLTSGYIRPLIYYAYGKMGLNPIGATANYMIAAWKWGKYLPAEAVKGCISNFMRIHPASVVSDAKVCGYYANSILASLDATRRGYHEAILLDYEGNVAEGPGENIFAVKDGVIYTPMKDNILAGLTRDTVFQICKVHGVSIEEKKFGPDFLKEADEVFFTGTAAEVTGLAQIDETIIGDGNIGPVTSRIKEEYLKIVTGKSSEFNHFLTYV